MSRLTSRAGRLGVAVLALAAAAPAVRAQEFSAAPLSAPVAPDRDSMPATPGAFMEWLRSQGAAGVEYRVQPVREHLYELISTVVKRRFTSSKAADFPRGDSTLSQMFSWGDQLGVAGAGEVARAMGAGPATSATAGPGEGLQLTFSPPLFSLVSQKGKWMVKLPWYFMVGLVTRQKLNNGVESDAVEISTLAATNNPAIGGSSQASIVLLSAQTDSLPSYVAYWLHQMKLAPGDTVPPPVPQAVRSYRRYDPMSGLWKELVAMKIPTGSLIATYSGLDGTFQANRAHFVDLLGTLRVRR